MALIKCPECCKDISDKSPACIHCGYPLESFRPKESEKVLTEPMADLNKQSSNISKMNKSDLSSSFSIVSFAGKNVRLQCEKCKRISNYLQSVVLTNVSDKEGITNTTICCPSCENTMRKGLRIERTALNSEQDNAISNKQDDSTEGGCLGWLVFIGLIVVFGMFLITDGFSDLMLWWLVFPLTFVAFIVVGLIYSFATSDSKEVKENWDKEKYNNYMFTCPMCGSNKVKKIGTMNRVASVATVGLASGKIGKQYECDNCKHKW